MSALIGVLVVFTGLVGLVLKRNIVMKIIALDVMNVGVVLFFVALGYGDNPPIITGEGGSYADPIPQAVIITAIVIGFTILTLSIALTSMLIEKTKRMDSDDLERVSK